MNNEPHRTILYVADHSILTAAQNILEHNPDEALSFAIRMIKNHWQQHKVLKKDEAKMWKELAALALTTKERQILQYGGDVTHGYKEARKQLLEK